MEVVAVIVEGWGVWCVWGVWVGSVMLLLVLVLALCDLLEALVDAHRLVENL